VVDGKEMTDENYNTAYRRPTAETEILFGQCEDKKDQKTDPNTGKKYPIPQRIKRALGVVLKESPDIITLQELDHWEYFEKVLGELGYEGHKELKKYDKRLHEYNGGYKQDGVAIFWNKNRFTKKYADKYKLHKVDKKSNKKIDAEAGQRLMYVVLENEAGKEFAVVTGHFKSGKKPADETLKTSHVRELTQLLKKRLNGKPVIFACDFNTEWNTKPLVKFRKLNRNEVSLPLGRYGKGKHNQATKSWRAR